MMSFWPLADRPPHRMEMTASTHMTHFADAAAPGVSCRHRAIMPKVPILSRTPTSSTEVPGRATAAVSGSQVCTGTMGALIAKATMKVTKTTI